MRCEKIDSGQSTISQGQSNDLGWMDLYGRSRALYVASSALRLYIDRPIRNFWDDSSSFTKKLRTAFFPLQPIDATNRLQQWSLYIPHELARCLPYSLASGSQLPDVHIWPFPLSFACSYHFNHLDKDQPAESNHIRTFPDMTVVGAILSWSQLPSWVDHNGLSWALAGKQRS